VDNAGTVIKLATIPSQRYSVKQVLAALVFLTIGLMADEIRADLFEPFSTSNLNPFVQLHGIPATRSANLVEKSRFEWNLTTSIANNFTANTSRSESIAIDGETWRSSVTATYGLTDRIEIGVEVPFIRHSGGSLDGLIENWHEVFGLPNGGRGDMQSDRLTYAWISGVTTHANLQSSTSGMGDATLHLGYRLNSGTNRSWSLRTGVKLATGDAEKLTGSDSTDIFASLHMTQTDLFGRSSLVFHGSLGAINIGDGNFTENQLEDWVAFGSAMVTWQPWDRISLKTQLDFNSPLYDSDLKELGDPSVQLGLGGAIKLTDRTVLNIAVIEDIITDTSPDVVFHLGLRTRF
jgi:hypothetical protein